MVDARTVMTTELVTVRADCPVHEAVALLVEHRLSGLPVVDDQQRLLGLITEKDLLRLLLDHVAGEVGNLTVADLMTTEVTTFAPSTSLIEICQTLVNQPFRRVPLVEQGKLVGLISRRDIIRYIHGLRLKKG